MPVHPSEERGNTEGNITDQVAQESKDSTASNHPIHKDKASVMDHQSKGPQLTDSLPNTEGSKEELQAKAREMNK